MGGLSGRELEREYVHVKEMVRQWKQWLIGLLQGNARKHQVGKDWRWEGFQDEEEYPESAEGV